jgi:hypothetical protein
MILPRKKKKEPPRVVGARGVPALWWAYEHE